MKRSALSTYCVLVCVVAMAASAALAVFALYQLAALIYPKFGMPDYQLSYHSNPESYGGREFHWSLPARLKDGTYTIEELKEGKEKEYRQDVAAVRVKARRSLIQLALALAVTVPLFGFHYRLMKKSEPARPDNAG